MSPTIANKVIPWAPPRKRHKEYYRSYVLISDIAALKKPRPPPVSTNAPRRKRKDDTDYRSYTEAQAP